MFMSQKQSGAQRLVACLLAHGVERVFCVPGESYLSVLDALFDVRDKIQLVVCRHEAGAANMAEAYGKLTGRPGVCFVTRGPGATHASIAVHTARQDSTPVILFIGQVARGDRTREAFQEIDYRLFFGPITKWADEIDDAARVEEFVTRAFSVAAQGRMGPVALALPEDMLDDRVEADRAVTFGARAESGLSAAQANAIGDALEKAAAPILVLGGSGWSEEARRDIRAFIECQNLPTVLSFRRKDVLDNTHANYVGDLGLGPNPKLVARIKAADVVIAIGARLGENPSQAYSLFSRAESAEKLIHVHADAEELNRVWPTRMAFVSDVAGAAAALRGLGKRTPDLGETVRAARQDYEAWASPVNVSGAVNPAEIMSHLNETLAKDAIITNGAGNYAAWLHRFIKHREGGRQIAPTSGAMGYGVPAAISAKLAFPKREVICFAGDGCFMMSAQELATAAQYDARVIFIVIDNSSYGTIRMHQERDYPGRVSGTDIRNPDFAAFARSFGLFSATVETTAEFAPAFAAAREVGRPALIHVKTDVRDIAPGKTLA
jgi:acetolactate synthase-1/2/3 large subunit